MNDQELARDIVGRPTVPKVGVCAYCGGSAPSRTVCSAHADLIRLDPVNHVAVTQATTPRAPQEARA